jgi:hypothetical protein
MKKKLLALLLTLVMLLSLSVPALAADDVRETDFFEDQEHADVNFEDMTFEMVDSEAVLAAFEETRALVDDPANIDAVREGFLAACALNTHAETMLGLSNILSDLNVFDTEMMDAHAAMDAACTEIYDGLLGLARDILKSPCASALDDIVNEVDREFLLDYEDMTDEEEALEAEITGLQNEYTLLAAEEATPDELGEIYLRLVDAYKRRAALNGYDNYADYSYENGYLRDYTPLEIREFHALVKENIVPLFDQALDILISSLFAEGIYDVFLGDFTGDIALDIIDPYMAALSSELYEAFTYMRSHHLYDSGYGDTKNVGGYTSMLPEYKAPFFYNSPSGYVTDLSTAVHEFGHYNNAYWLDGSWYNGDKSIDLCEVHSQGLELLFTAFYPEVFGESAGEFVAINVMYEMLGNALLYGCLIDELEQFVYETEDVTVQQINEKFCALEKEYGFLDPEDETTEEYDWTTIPHIFITPCYYISYAVAAAGAFEFWMESQQDYFSAVDKYLAFTAQKMDEYGFQESFEVLGMQSPITPEFFSVLTEELSAYLAEAAERFAPLTAADVFTDVDGDEAWYDAVACLYDYGILNGVSEDTLDPDGSMTRAQASTVLCRLFSLTEAEGADYFPDVTEGHWYTEMVNAAYENDLIHGFTDGTFRPGDAMSRQDFAVLLYNIFTTYFGTGFEETWSFDLGAADAEAVGGYALEAVSWGVMNGYFGLDENACLRPADELTRAEMAEMVYYAFFAE